MSPKSGLVSLKIVTAPPLSVTAPPLKFDVVFSGLEIFPEIFGNISENFQGLGKIGNFWKFIFIQKQDRDEGDRPFNDLNH